MRIFTYDGVPGLIHTVDIIDRNKIELVSFIANDSIAT